MANDDEEERLRSTATQDAGAIQLARQRADDEVRKQLEWQRITLSSIGDAVISTDAEARVTFMNVVAESLTGWTQADASGVPLSDVFNIVNEQTREPCENPALRALRLGTIVGLANHTILIARDGTERPIDDSAAPIRDEAGVRVGAVLVFRDVSESRRADEVRAQLAAILESSEDAIISKSLDGTIRFWNAGAERLFGYTAAEAVGQSITLIVPHERLEEERTILERLRRGERIEHFETVRVSKQGRRIDVSLMVSPLRNSEGRIIGASKVGRDITQRKRAEEALRESERRYRQAAAQAATVAEANAKFRAFFEQMSFAAVLNLDGTVVEANQLYLDVCGSTRDAVIGRPFWESGCWSPSAALMEMVQAACMEAAAGRLFRKETDYFGVGGAARMIDLVLAPVTDDAGRVLFVAVTGTDVTDQRQMEDSLRENDRKKDQFIAMLAHELRNPLAPLRNGLELIRLAGNDSGTVSRVRDVMDRQLVHMVRLIDDLLDISRISQNKMELRRSQVELKDVVNAAVETARPAIETAGHEFTVTLPPEPVQLNADLTRLAQVFSNLLTNSAKYTEPGGHIWLSAESQGTDVIVTVRDTGIGIPAGDLPHIFDMFSQVDRSMEHNTGGLGIGLALVKGLVEMHDGTVRAASAGQGRGSTFTVRLPALPRTVEPLAGPASTAEGSTAKRHRILVVDDNRDAAESMADILKLMGHDVRTAYDGIEAVETADAFRPDTILMDLGMPRLNGYDATRQIRQQPWGHAVLIIALTGWGQGLDRARSKLAGCDGHLVKPVSLSDLESLFATFGR